MGFLKDVQKVVNETTEKVANTDVLSDMQAAVDEGEELIKNIPVEVPEVPDAPSSVNIAGITIELPPIPTKEELEAQLKTAVKDKLTEVATSAINDLRSQIPDPREQASQMIAEIESYREQLDSMLDQLNPLALINKALDKAEKICEEYIDSKMVQVFNPIHLKGLSDAEFSLNGTKINAGLTLYLVLGDFEGDFRNNYIKNITANLEIDLANLQFPRPFPTPVLNDGNFNVEDEIKRRFEREQARIIEELGIVMADSYMPVFTVIDKFKGLLKI
ncbi:hypothetical protein [Bacillus atrophaeus]|uniref:hypothetical protein n=1 Tax=Bacillus atrophaeus TaxID=1452 RepID=UPI003D20BFAA